MESEHNVKCINCHHPLDIFRNQDSLCIDCFITKNEKDILNDYFTDKYNINKNEII